MRVLNVARVIRIPVLAAAVVLPMLVTACGNDPLAPTAQPSRSSAPAATTDSTGRSTGGSIPWFDSQITGKSGGSIPWF